MGMMGAIDVPSIPARAQFPRPEGVDMGDDHTFQETKDGKPNVNPEALGEPEPLKNVIGNIAEGIAAFLEGEPPRGAHDTGHVEGAGEGGA
jgi:hypothetical protein